MKVVVQYTVDFDFLPEHCGKCPLYKATTESSEMWDEHYCPFRTLGVKVETTGCCVTRPRSCPLSKRAVAGKIPTGHTEHAL
jgi:hypothetical protein